MGKTKFDRKKAVRFQLVPGPDKDGRPTVLFKPVQTRKSKLTKKEKKDAISKFADIEEITINGKVVDQNQIPAYVLQQIRGRTDLVYNQKHPMKEEQIDQGDLYDIQDGGYEEGDEEYEEYEDYEDGVEKIEEHQNDNEDEWQDEDQEGQQIQVDKEEDIEEQIVQKFQHKIQEFPSIQEMETIQIQGKQYTLTKAQVKMLDSIIPQNYEEMDFGGLKFKKYNEDGLLLSDKQKYEKYMIGDNEKVVVVDTFQYVPVNPIDTLDNDLKPSQITGNANIKELQAALDYEGEQQAYDQLEDDFFAKMIRDEIKDIKPKKNINKIVKEEEIRVVSQPKKIQKKQVLLKQLPVGSTNVQKSLDEQLESAMFNFQNNIEENKPKNLANEDSDEEQEEQSNRNFSMNFTDIEKREEYIGRDGELDWRMLSKKQKREYMKTKVIRQNYDELRDRQIEQKMKGKQNITPDQLHLKTLIRHINYEDDHVMQNALERQLKAAQKSSDQEAEEYSSVSDDDDIVSFHQKTSIIASNLSMIQQPNKKKKRERQVQQPDPEDLERIKVVPEQRNRNQTQEQRQQRKKKLKEMKDKKKEQKKEFAQKFTKIKKQTMKKQNHTNPLNKISYVKIY